MKPAPALGSTLKNNAGRLTKETASVTIPKPLAMPPNKCLVIGLSATPLICLDLGRTNDPRADIFTGNSTGRSRAGS